MSAAILSSPAFADDSTATSASPSLSSLDTWKQWVDPTSYDWSASTVPGTSTPALQMSNWVSDPGSTYGNINELNSPTIAPAGAPGGTDADGNVAAYNTFTASYVVTPAQVAAQPGLAVEVSADNAGNRAGGSLLIRHDQDGKLQLTNFSVPYGSTDDDLSDWVDATAEAPFTKSVTVTFVDHFEQNGADVVSVYANGSFLFSGGDYQTYESIEGQPLGTVDSLLFRAGHASPDASGVGWDQTPPTDDEAAALKGNGFYFSNVQYWDTNTIALTRPVITGTAAVGSVLTANATDDVSATRAYQWYANGVAIPGATKSTYTVASSVLGKRISVGINATTPGFVSSSSTSAQTDKVTLGVFTNASIAISGDAVVGSTLTATATTSPVATYLYQWYRGASPITGATSSKYRLTANDLGANVTVKATVVKSLYSTSLLTSSAVGPVLTGTITIGSATVTGTGKVGSTVTAAASATSGTSRLYQWYLGDPGLGQLISASTSGKFVIPSYAKGHTLYVVVTAFGGGFTSATSEASVLAH